MHELGIAQDFWAVIKRYAQEHRLNKISKIVILLGEASGIEESFLVHSFKDHILPQTLAEGAVFEVVHAKLTAKCATCGKEISKDEMTGLNCPGCKGSDIEIMSGKESYVQSIEGE
jgi:hydrogenase nickel incorporation protein HypA/HybF